MGNALSPYLMASAEGYVFKEAKGGGKAYTLHMYSIVLQRKFFLGYETDFLSVMVFKVG